MFQLYNPSYAQFMKPNHLNNLSFVLLQNGASLSMSELSIESEESLELQHLEEDVSNSAEWRAQEKHVFILSSAGKPIYSR